jgi:zinc and cadmium transporter
MKPSISLVLSAALLGDIIVFLSSALFLSRKSVVKFLSTYATPFAAGALLAAAFIDFLHEGVEQYEPLIVLTSALVGVVGFFILEGWLHWFHHHGKEPFEGHTSHSHQADPIVALAAGGNWLHNFIDGAAIAAAFLVSVPTGVITTIAVALHEIPREMADSGYLLSRGMSRQGVIGVHGVAILATIAGTVLFYLTAQQNTTLLGVLLGSTAGFFIYIAASDIIPSINASRTKAQLIDIPTGLVAIGAGVLGLVIILSHRFIG